MAFAVKNNALEGLCREIRFSDKENQLQAVVYVYDVMSRMPFNLP